MGVRRRYSLLENYKIRGFEYILVVKRCLYSVYLSGIVGINRAGKELGRREGRMWHKA